MKALRNVSALLFVGVLVVLGIPDGTLHAQSCHVTYLDPNGFDFDFCSYDCAYMAGVCQSHCGGPYNLFCDEPGPPSEGRCRCNPM
jgi:hypothetical protein